MEFRRSPVARWSARVAILTGLGFVGVGSVVIAQTVVPSSRGRTQAPLAASAAVTGPLDPLNRTEIRTAIDVVEADSRFPADGYFPTITLNEPPKAEVLEWDIGESFRARGVRQRLLDRDANKLFEIVVNLRTETVKSWVQKPNGTQPPVFFSEVRRRRRRRARGSALAPGDGQSRGIPRRRTTSTSTSGPRRGRPARFVPLAQQAVAARDLSFYQGDSPNPYDRPIEGVLVTIDMTLD